MFLWTDNFQGLHRLFSSLCFPMLRSDMGGGAFPFSLQTCEKTKAVPSRGEIGDEGKDGGGTRDLVKGGAERLRLNLRGTKAEEVRLG